MEQFTLKKNYSRLGIIFTSLMILGSICLISYIELLTGMLLVLGLLFIFLSLYIPYNFLKIPEISVANNTLQFGKSYFDLSTAKEFLLNAKRGSFLNSTLGCVKITFSDGQMLTIDDWNYANINAFKVLLNSLYNKETLRDYDKIKTFDIDPPLTYKGSFLWSFRGILFIIMQISIWVIWFTVTSNRSIFGFILITLVFYSYFLIQANYVILSGNQIIIKNYLFPWKEYIHLLSDTLEISVDSNFRMADSITIISDDYKCKKYYAGTIRDHEWRRLKVKLTELEIPVIDNQNI